MSEVKVIAWQKDLDDFENAINERVKNTEKLNFPEGFVEKINEMQSTLDMLVSGQIEELTFYKETVPDDFFYCNQGLKKINLPNAKYIGQEAFYSSEIEEVNGEKLEELEQYAFYDSSLKTIHASNIKKLNGYAFSYTELTEINFPELVETQRTEFSNCPLTSCYLPKLETIGSSCFQGCSSLQKIELPKVKGLLGYDFQNDSLLEKIHFLNLEKISGSYNFKNCSMLKSIIIETPIVCNLSSTNAFTGSSMETQECFIYVPDSLVEDYKNATNWSVYASQIKPLSEYNQIGGV